ncbi:MAG: PQQ-binding-like beta-propeller repeat protein [bacterium]|nr:PQQ-binding-like beta-propeller repeat protein [bacterium]
MFENEKPNLSYELVGLTDFNKDVDDFLQKMDIKISRKGFKFQIPFHFPLPALSRRTIRILLVVFNLTALLLSGFLGFKYVRPVRIQNMTLDQLWEYRTLAPVYSTPLVADINNDHVNDVIVNSSDGKLYSLDGFTGKRHFFFETESPLLASPVLLQRSSREKHIVLATGENRLYLLDSDKRCIWSTIRQDLDSPVISTPLVLKINGDEVLDIVVGAEDGKLYAFDGDRGWLIWKTKATKGRFFSTPLAMDINQDGISDLVIGSPENTVYGIDGRTGSKIWETATEGPVNSSAVSLDKTTFFIGDEQGTIYKINSRTGRIIASVNTGSGIVSTPVIINNPIQPLLVVPLQNGTVRTFSSATLKSAWSYDTKSQDAFTSSPAVFDMNNDTSDDLVLTSRNGNVYILNGQNGKDLVRPYFTGNSISSSPVLADINRDKQLEIIFGSENGSITALSLKTVPDKLISANRIVYGSFLNK